MAIFKDDKMVGTMDCDTTLGYVMAMEDVKRCTLTVETDLGRAVLRIAKLKCKRKVSVEDDGTVKITLKIVSTMTVGQLTGLKV
jgi:hypothetical protein